MKFGRWPNGKKQVNGFFFPPELINGVDKFQLRARLGEISVDLGNGIA